MVLINLASGPHPLPGWINVDLDPAGAQVVADFARTLPFGTARADFLHCEDFIAQLPPVAALAFLRECRRVVKSSGVLRLLTPDLAKLARMYLERPDDLVRIWTAFVGVPLVTGSACEVVNLGMQLAGKFQYDFATLAELAAQAGFDAVEVAYNRSAHAPLRGIDLRSPADAVSLYLECTPRPRT
jgi:hypothetical protein